MRRRAGWPIRRRLFAILAPLALGAMVVPGCADSTTAPEGASISEVAWTCFGCENQTIRTYVGDTINPKFVPYLNGAVLTNDRWVVETDNAAAVKIVPQAQSEGGIWAAMSKGTATVTARLVSHKLPDGSEFVWRRTIVVGDPPARVVATPETRTLAVGEELDLVAEVQTAAGEPVHTVIVFWRGSSCGTVDFKENTAGGCGKFGTPMRVVAKANGTATFRAEYRFPVTNTTFTDDVTLTVAPPASATTVTVASAETGPILVGGTRQYTATVKDQNGATMPGATVSWSVASSTPAGAATVSSTGVVSCAAAGDVRIRATVTGSTTFGETDVRCNAPAAAVAGIVLDPLELTVPVGHTQLFRARLLDAQGRETTPATGYRVVYAVASSAIAENAGGDITSGRVTAKAVGSTRVNAYYAPVSGGAPVHTASAMLRVGHTTAGAVAAVRIGTTHLLASAGVSMGHTAVALDAAGNEVPGVTFRWSSSNPAAATVTPTSGMVSAEAAGGALIFASAVLPNGELGPTGVTAVTVRTAGAILANVTMQAGPGSVPAAGATLRAYQNGVEKGVGVVPVASPAPGRAYIPGLAAGSYTVTVSLPGFAVQTFENVTVTASTVTQLNGGNSILLISTP